MNSNQLFLLMMDLERSKRGRVKLMKYTERNCAPNYLHLQDYIEMHVRQNQK